MRGGIVIYAVRKALFLLLIGAALAVPPVVLAERVAKGDGTLSVKDGNGTVTLSLSHGIVFGRIASGRVRITDFKADDENEPEFFGTCDNGNFAPNEVGVSFCRGKDLRFRFAAGRYDLKILGSKGINITAVGQGTGSIVSAGATDGDDGTYSVNGKPYEDLPLLVEAFTLAQT
jgi:hypothetical protein